MNFYIKHQSYKFPTLLIKFPSRMKTGHVVSIGHLTSGRYNDFSTLGLMFPWYFCSHMP